MANLPQHNSVETANLSQPSISHAHQKLVKSYIDLIERYAALACNEGYEVSPYKRKESLYFAHLPESMQIQTVNHLRHFVEVCEEVVYTDQKTLRDNRHFLWRMIQKSNLHPSSDLFSHIEKEDLIEIYNLDFIQIFRNMSFFEVCSYSLDEVLSRPWWELFRRDPKITEHLIEKAQLVFTGQHKGTIHFESGVHVIDEIDSPRRNRGVVENKIFSPLFDQHENIVAGVTVIQNISCQTDVAIN